MKWEIPHKTKVYEALGAIADGRVEGGDLEAKVYSSSRGKFYEVKYNPQQREIMSNDNASFYVGVLGYPAIALLMRRGDLPFIEEYATALCEIAWKDINQKNKNDFDKTQMEIDEVLLERGIDLQKFHEFVDRVLDEIVALDLGYEGEKTQPPTGY